MVAERLAPLRPAFIGAAVLFATARNSAASPALPLGVAVAMAVIIGLHTLLACTRYNEFGRWFGCVVLTDLRTSGEPCLDTSLLAKCDYLISPWTKSSIFPRNLQIIAVDVPIGLPDVTRPGGRTCDRLARRLLGPRSASVFSPIGRICLQMDDRKDAGQLVENEGIEPEIIVGTG